MQASAVIDVVAPSSPFDPAKFARGIAALRAIGLTPRYDEAIFSKAGHLAGDDQRRFQELERALAAPDSQAVILARGGYGLLRLAKLLKPFDKLLIGYSDATVLHVLQQQHGKTSIHGPMCTQLGEEPDALQRLQQLLNGQTPEPIEFEPDTAQPGTAEGLLAGGNLATLASLCGTQLQPNFRDCIVLLEDLNEPPYRLDRLLTQLLESNALQGARGFVIGDLTAPGEDPGNRVETVAERLLPLDVPLVFNAPFGHAGRNQPVLFGAPHFLDATEGILSRAAGR